MVQCLREQAALPGIQVQFPAPTWLLSTFWNSSLRDVMPTGMHVLHPSKLIHFKNERKLAERSTVGEQVFVIFLSPL